MVMEIGTVVDGSPIYCRDELSPQDVDFDLFVLALAGRLRDILRDREGIELSARRGIDVGI
jgi:hypothetical protein